MKITAAIDKIRHQLSISLIPHKGNNHHPWAIRHQGLALFTLGILVSQILTNVAVGKPAFVLGFATDIQKEQLISQTNQQRQSNGVGTVTESPALSQAAMLKARDMFANNYWAHVSPKGTTPWHWFNLVGYSYQYAGENLAKGFDTSGGVISGWMNSPSHRENLLNPNYKEIGMAVLNGQLDGEATTLVVQFFGTVLGSTAVAQTPPTPTKQVTLRPTPIPTVEIIGEASSTGSVVGVVPPGGNFPTSPIARVLEIYQPKGALNTNQQVLALSLMILATIFIVDALVLIRKRLLHTHSHSLLHALVIIVLISFILVSGKGLIL